MTTPTGSSSGAISTRASTSATSSSAAPIAVLASSNHACGPGALKVADIPAGTTPRLPKTWPGLPILIDSPGWSPVIRGRTVTVRVPFDDITPVRRARFDGVTAGLRVNASLHVPLLCVTDVFKTASGDLSLPGTTD